jgi:death on curing protein
MSSEAEAINMILALAAGEIDEPGFSGWLKDKSVIRAEKE